MKKKDYSPTSYFFNLERWANVLKSKGIVDENYINAGMIIGTLLYDIDSKFQAELEKCGQLSEMEVIYFQQHETIRYFQSLEKGGSPDNFEIILEAISDGCKLLVAQTKIESEVQKSVEFYQNLLKLACERLYLCEQWKRVENGRTIVVLNENGYRFQPTSVWLDFGEKMAVSRYQDHLNQVRYDLFQTSESHFPLLFSMPYEINVNGNHLMCEFQCLELTDVIHANSIASQIPFYLEELATEQFSKYSLVTIVDLMLFWIIMSKLASLIVKAQLTTTAPVYRPFDQNFLAEVLSRCAGFSQEKSLQVIEVFTNNKNQLEDFYFKPIYRIRNDYFLCLPSLISGQFTRVADYYVSMQILSNEEKVRNLEKGKHFENKFALTLQDQIDKNDILKSIFCKVLCIGFKQRKGKQNEEIDLVLRIGETYLIIEAKSFSYRTGCQGFHNNMKTLKSSNIERKREFFIEDYELFRDKYDPSANFTLNPANVICCYLSSVPHCVGININDVKVVDPSILERYFGNGNFELVDLEGNRSSFKFYDCAIQAEKNLNRYLIELPQLTKYYRHFKYSDGNYVGVFKDSEVKFQEPYFDLTESNEVKTFSELKQVSDSWSSTSSTIIPEIGSLTG